MPRILNRTVMESLISNLFWPSGVACPQGIFLISLWDLKQCELTIPLLLVLHNRIIPQNNMYIRNGPTLQDKVCVLGILSDGFFNLFLDFLQLNIHYILASFEKYIFVGPSVLDKNTWKAPLCLCLPNSSASSKHALEAKCQVYCMLQFSAMLVQLCKDFLFWMPHCSKCINNT